jgi:prepilin-type N-terminal cleavage/methylation domain-containing protein
MKKRGLTLIELMTVVAILAILIAVFAANIQGCGGNTSMTSANGVAVDTIFIGPTFNEAAAMQQAIVQWQIDHPNRRIVSTMKGTGIGGRNVIITSEPK